MIAVAPIFGKNNLLLRDRRADFHENWGLLSIIACINYDPGVTLTYLNFVTQVLLWEKVKTVDFSETIAACDLKVGRFRQLIEFMEVCLY